MRKEFNSHVKDEKTDFEDLTKVEKESMPEIDTEHLSFPGGQGETKEDEHD